MSEDLALISLAPTQTEIVAALGMVRNLAGVTEDCDFPAGVKTIRRFGSWYSPDIDGIVRAAPDLVFTFGSHQEEVAALLAEAGIRVYHSEPPTIAASLESMGEIAALLGREETWEEMAESLEKRLERIRTAVEAQAGGRRPRIFRIMNWDPLITPGPGAFQHDVIEFSGGINTAGDGPASYFVCDSEQMRARDPEIIFFCEPHIRGLIEADPGWRQVSAVRCGRVFVFDCGLTCRSGPRIVDMAEKLSEAVLAGY
ncbi:MAG: helical backbone metal receptor [Syntrophobacteraceae bacterium]